MFSKFLKSKWWHIFCVFYMLAVVAYILYFAFVHHIFMVGFLVSTIFMGVLELSIFLMSPKKA